MYFETYLIRNVVLFQLYVPLYLLFISTHCVIVVSPLPQNIDSHTYILSSQIYQISSERFSFFNIPINLDTDIFGGIATNIWM